MKKLDIEHAGLFLWTIELLVECPYCLQDFDANLTDDFSEQIMDVQVCEGKDNINVLCPKCDREFTFDIGSGT